MSNVSSVKNLNGEVFSAIQDASLTDLVNDYGVSINDVSSTVKTYSGQWGGGGSVDTIPVAVISPLVTGFSGESAYLGIESTALNLSSYVPVSSIGYNGTYISTISGKTISSYTGRYAMTANYANTAGRAYQDRNSNEITSYYQPKLSIAGDAGTITAINGSAVGASIPEGWELVAGAGIDIVDDAENNQTIISATGGGTTYTGVAPIIVTGNTISADSFDLTSGPGIKIDQPSEGVVRIGNDETVLWSGARFTTGYRDLNESFLNFEQIRFKVCTEDQDNWQYKLYPCITTAQYFNASVSQIWPGTTTATWIKTALWKPTSETRISGVAQALQRITTSGISNNYQTTAGWVGIYEIVGINRISGSNA